jgi:hypothetical protein
VFFLRRLLDGYVLLIAALAVLCFVNAALWVILFLAGFPLP